MPPEVWVALYGLGVPGVLAAVATVVASRTKARLEHRIAAVRADLDRSKGDRELATVIRDELRAENVRLRERIAILESENDTHRLSVIEMRMHAHNLQLRVTRLEDALRRHGHANEIEDVV